MMALSGVMSPRAWSVRIARASVFALAGTGMGVAAHSLGGGMTPSPLTAVAALVGLFALALAFSGSQRRLPVIMGLVLTTQTLMHLGFTAAGIGSMANSGSAQGGNRSLLSLVLCHTAAHAPSDRISTAALATLTTLHVSPSSATHAPTMQAGNILTPSMAWMLVAHLLAATAMAWWLARGERAVWECARRVVQTIQAVAEGFPADAPTAAPDVDVWVVALLRTRWRMLCAPGRGPPELRSSSLLPAAC